MHRNVALGRLLRYLIVENFDEQTEPATSRFKHSKGKEIKRERRITGKGRRGEEGKGKATRGKVAFSFYFCFASVEANS